MEQISMLDVLAKKSLENKPEPILKVGDKCFVTIVDKVYECFIKNLWDITDSEGFFKDYGYDVRGEYSSVVFNKEIGTKVFTAKVSAEAKALANRQNVKKMLYSSNDIKQFIFIRYYSIDEAKYRYSFAFLLRNHTVVYKNKFTYTFADEFNNEKEAFKCFDKHIKDIVEESMKHFNDYREKVEDIKELSSELFETIYEDLYFCENNKYSSLGYFYHNFYKSYDFEIKKGA